MPGQRAGESISQFAIRAAWEYGHFWSPDNPEGQMVKQSDLPNLKPDDPVVVKAMISLSKMDATRYTRHVLDKHGRRPDFDGVIGPAMTAMLLEDGRCPVPDFAPPPGADFLYEDPDLQQVALKMQRDAQEAVGSGSWPRCHGVGDFHCAAIRVNPEGMKSFLQPLFQTVLNNVQKAYAGVGLLFRFISMDGKDMMTGDSFSGTINSDMSFVQTSSGYIGIAIVGQNESCTSRIWNRYLASYGSNQSPADIVVNWSSLVRHELGHNCGLQHTAGGTMNSSIVNGLPLDWVPNDPSTPKLMREFGGVPVPIPGGGPTPPPPPNPPSSLEQRVHALEVQDVVQKVTIDWIVRKVKDLP